jgi:hypothetical protein
MSHLVAFAKRISSLAFRPASHAGSKTASRDDPDSLFTFQSETGQSATPRKTSWSVATRRKVMIASAATLLVAGSAAVVYVASIRLQAARSATPAVPASGTAVLDSNPPGTVTIGGVFRGRTPLSLVLPVGRHDVAIATGQATRSVTLEIEAGTTTKQYIEFAGTPAVATTTGRLDITSQPSGARVAVDGTPRGVTPISIAEISAGSHQVTVSSGETTIHRGVTIRPGTTSSVDASIAATESSAAGWLALTAPIELTMAEDDQIIGTTRAARLMLPAGNHNLVLANTALEFQTTMAVRVEGGKTLKRPVPLPNGSLSVNAVPWANVWVDGADIGTTPLANLSLPIGTHEIVWRHPQLGERRRTISITAKTPTRVGMDFKQ